MKASKDKGVPSKYKKVYQPRDAITHLYGDRLNARAMKKGRARGSGPYLAAYRRAVSRLMSNLTQKQTAEISQLLEKWNTSGPPDEVKIQ